MKSIWVVVLWSYFDVFDIKDFTVFETEDEARNEFKRVRKILGERYSTLHPLINTADVFEIGSDKVTVERREVGREIRIHTLPKPQQSIKCLVTVSYPEEYDNYDPWDDYEYEDLRFRYDPVDIRLDEIELNGLDLGDKLNHVRRRIQFLAETSM